MVTVKEAAQNALAFARDVLGDNRVNGLLLEEIELSDDEKAWLVTVSVPAPLIPANSIGLLTQSAGLTAEPRDYKLISVDTESGSPKSITIRKL